MLIKGWRTIVRLVTDFIVQLYGLGLNWSKRTNYMSFGVGWAYQTFLIETFLIVKLLSVLSFYV